MGPAPFGLGECLRILVTGADGMIGRPLVWALALAGHDIVAVTRGGAAVEGASVTARLDSVLRAGATAQAPDAIIHLAGISHRRADAHEYRQTNIDLTLALARIAGRARFVFASSVKALAERSDHPLTEQDAPAPRTQYGRSKLAAEQALAALDGLDWVALRPPLVHGPTAKANFAALLALAASGLPLPLANIAARRSIISIESAIAAFAAAATKSGPRGLFHIADRPSLSTPEIVTALREGLGRPPGLFSLGPLASALAIGPAHTLVEPLELDDSAFRAAYGYGRRSDIDSRAALRDTARTWKEIARKRHV